MNVLHACCVSALDLQRIQGGTFPGAASDGWRQAAVMAPAVVV